MTHDTEHDLLAQALHNHFVELGRKGGLAKSEKQNKARARNAKLGGWPKGRKRGPRKTITKETT